MKQCSKCKNFYTLDMFSKDKTKKDGLTYQCKVCRRKSYSNWASKNKDRKKEYDRKRNQREDIKEKNRQQRREQVKKKPWICSYSAAKDRCVNPRNSHYHIYGGRGIEFKMTTKDFEKLWYRDNASQMKRPSIDRIDNDGNYEYGNCQFIERVENTKKMWSDRRNKARLSKKEN